MVTPPDGQELDYVAITDAGGTSNVSAKSLAGAEHIYDSDVTFKFFWKGEGEQGTYDPVSIQDAEVKLSATGFTYNGKVQKPTIAAIGGMALSEGAGYSAEWSNASSKDVGTYTVTITGAGGYVGTTKATYQISKAANTLAAKAKSKKAVPVKAGKSLAAKKLFKVSKAQGKVTYKKAKGSKKISVAKNGEVKVKKSCKKGTYALTVKVTAEGDPNYKAATKTVKVKVKVR